MYNLEKKFEYENGFMATAEPRRFSKFISHLDFFNQTIDLRGEIVELGVFKGNSLFRWIKFRELLSNTYSRKIIAFDVFGEFPKTDFEDDKRERELFIKETDGGFGIEFSELNQLLTEQKINDNVQLIQGDILITLPEYLKNNPHLKISLLHIDLDIYEPTDLALKLLFDRVVKGGIIIFDDYGDFAGANKAIDDFFMHKIEIKKLSYSHNISYLIK